MPPGAEPDNALAAPPSSAPPHRDAGWLAAIVLATAALYLPGLNAGYFLDDFASFRPEPLRHVTSEFLHVNTYRPTRWRPLEQALLALQQAALGWQTWPGHLLQLLMHTGMAAAIFRLCRAAGGTPAQAGLAGLFCGVAHVGAQAVVGVDTISQVGATFCVVLAVCAMVRATDGLTRLPEVRRRGYGAAVTFLTLGLLMKESAASGLPILALLLVVATVRALRQGAGAAHAATRLLTALVPLVAVFLAYATWRWSLVETSDLPEQYSMRLGLNVPANVAQLLAAVFVPVSPHRILVWWHDRSVAPLALAALAGFVPVGLAAVGLLKSSGRTVALVAATGICAMLPVVLFARVAEMYAYHVLPAAAMLFGLGCGGLLERGIGRHGASGRRAVLVVMVAMLGSHAWALEEKIALMVGNGARARQLYDEVAAAVRQAPAGASVLLVNPPAEVPAYSVLHVPGFNLLNGALRKIREETGRTDVQLHITEPPVGPSRPDRLRYTIKADQLAAYDGP